MAWDPLATTTLAMTAASMGGKEAETGTEEAGIEAT